MDLFVVIVVHAPKKSKHCHVKITLYGHAKGFLSVFKASAETKDKNVCHCRVIPINRLKCLGYNYLCMPVCTLCFLSLRQ